MSTPTPVPPYGAETQVCPECGCRNVQRYVWAEVNTGSFAGDVDPDEFYCPDCDEAGRDQPTAVVPLEDWLAGRAQPGVPAMDPLALEGWLQTAIEFARDHDDDCPHERVEVTTFSDVGILSGNRGLVLRFEDGSEFQVSIVQSQAARGDR